MREKKLVFRDVCVGNEWMDMYVCMYVSTTYLSEQQKGHSTVSEHTVREEEILE